MYHSKFKKKKSRDQGSIAYFSADCSPVVGEVLLMFDSTKQDMDLLMAQLP